MRSRVLACLDIKGASRGFELCITERVGHDSSAHERVFVLTWEMGHAQNT